MWELQHYACRVAALPCGGQFLRPEGCWSSCFCKPEVVDNAPDWKDEQLEGWRPEEATEVTAIQNHGSRLKGIRVKEDHACGEEKELLCLCGSQRTQLCNPGWLSQTAPWFLSCHVITFLYSDSQQQELLHLCSSTEIIYGVYF